MRVLHVSLGLPPLRTGGLTRYCTDVMNAQAAAGNEVSLVFPGRYSYGKTRIRSGSWQSVSTYEVINSLPVALTYGIAEPDAFCSPCNNPTSYRRLLDDIYPDVVHVHSYQGIHREFFEAVHNTGVPVVYTTHDYYPICPRCTLISSWGESCPTGPGSLACATCNNGSGMTVRRSRVMQSNSYARMKDSKLVRAVGARTKRDMSQEGLDRDAFRSMPAPRESAAYKRLLEYNSGIFSLFDLVMANSSMAMNVYQRYFPNAEYELLPITHAGLERNKTPYPVNCEGAPLRIGYYGGCKAYKGYDTLIEACKIIDKEGLAFELHLYGDDYGSVPVCIHAINHGRLDPQAVCETWQTLDMVVVPSKCRETFGFVALEALCSGVPIICSDVVGAQDLVDEESIFHAGDAVDLARKIEAFEARRPVPAYVPFDYPISMDEQVKRLDCAYRRAAAISRQVDSDKGFSSRV